MTHFFRRFIVVALVAATVAPSYAIPATPYPVVVTQPDGSQLTVNIRGDEHGAVMLTSDGYPVVQDSTTGRYEFAEIDGAFIRSLGIQASGPENRSPAIDAQLAGIDRSSVWTYLDASHMIKKQNRRNPQRVKISNYPTIGHQKALVILVEFEDTPFTTMSDPYGYYQGLLNEEGFTWDNGANGSARDFYLASSAGMFDPEFTVVGPVRLDKPVKYYGGDSEFLDENVADMVIEASKKADALVDYSQFDADGDGYVDNIYFFYAGYGQADSGHNDAVWPHSGTLEESWGKELILDGIRLNRYACSNEIRGGSGPDFKPVGIGTFVHEFGHVLGIADHYDTGYQSGRTGVNQWDTMAAASYFNNQNTPPLFNAFERAELGWLEYTQLPSTAGGWIDMPLLDTDNVAYRVDVEGTDGREYFVVEHRCREGWDTYLPGEGMLVWHVDMDEERWWNNTINNDPDHQCLDLIEADGREDAGSYAYDPFPGRGDVRQFVFNGWTGDEAFSFDDIEKEGARISFLLGNTGYKPDSPEVNVHKTGGISTEFSFEPVDGARYYIVDLLDAEGVAFPGYDGLRLEEPAAIMVDGLTPLSSYDLRVYAGMGSYLSEPAVCRISTSEIRFFEMTPEISLLDAVSASGFTLGWNPLPGAEDYSVTVSEKSYGETESSTCDFSEWPEGWSSSSAKLNKAMFGNSSPALQLGDDGDYVEFDSDGNRIASLSLWVRSQSASNRMRIDYRAADSDEFTPLTEVELTTQGQQLSFDIPESSVVRVIFMKGSGYMVVDDFECSYSPLEWLAVDGFTGISTGGECKMEISGLTQQTTYRVAVSGYDGNETSRTATATVTTADGSGISSIDSKDKVSLIGRYAITGQKVSANYRGVVIERYSDGTTRKLFEM